MAVAVGADVVVVHPPFRWQRDYARGFVEGIAELEERTGVAFAVENMYPWRASRREMQVYVPGWDPSEQDYANTTIDLSHSAVARSDPVAMARAARGPAAAHPHDRRHRLGQGRAPGARAAAPSPSPSSSSTSPASASTATSCWRSTPARPADREARELDLLEALAFTRLNFAVARRDLDDRAAAVAGAAVRAARTPAARSSPRPGSPSPTRASPVRRSARVAAEAGVDPALVHHYFGAKDDLFLAALEIPVDPRTAGAAGVRGRGRRRPGSGCCGCSCRCGTTRTPGCRCSPWCAAAWSQEGPESLLQQGMLRMVLAPLRAALPADEADRRVQLVVSQLVGLVVTRYLLELEPLASMPAEDVVAAVAPTLQRYLDGPLS